MSEDRGMAADRGDFFGGHEFEYESSTDLFRCTECRQYEIIARQTAPDGRPITQCPGWAVEGHPGRAYLLVTENPDVPVSGYVAGLATSIMRTGLGRTPRYSWRAGRMVVQSAPGVVDDLARQIERMQSAAAALVERITEAEAEAILAENRAAYAAKYGKPA